MTTKSHREKLTEDMVYASTELGIEITQEIAAQVLVQRPGISLKEFTKVLDDYVARIKLPS
tara:strand:+ start:1703 stop:1885 length:183 start_codon:yes stop_codon:yes gene_type:complete